MKNQLIAVAALSLVSSLGWSAVMPPFAQVDSNQDSYIDRAESAVNAELSSNFNRIDSDANGKLSLGDYNAFINTLVAGAAPAAPVLAAKSFAELDVNHDGQLTGEEVAFVDRTADQYNQADIDKDSRLNQAEFDAYMSMSSATQLDPAGLPTFAALDTNHDGMVVKPEYQAGLLGREGIAAGSRMGQSAVDEQGIR